MFSLQEDQTFLLASLHIGLPYKVSIVKCHGTSVVKCQGVKFGQNWAGNSRDIADIELVRVAVL